MARSQQIITTLKQQLKLKGFTYRRLAKALNLSESTIKQMFANNHFSLKRLDAICEILDLELSDLVALHESKSTKIELLSLEDEKELVSDIPLLLIAYCVTNYWTFEEIVQKFTLSQSKCIQCLIQLDKMKMIELLPENKFRLLISRHFKWQKNGPIEQFFRQQVQDKFFNSHFSGELALHSVKLGDLTNKSIMQLIDRLNSVGQLYEELCQDDRKQPFEHKSGASMVLAIRQWEFAAFHQYLKK